MRETITTDQIGDLHNFGKQVKFALIDGEGFFLKPRPVYWENLFFGLNSPLRKVFSDARFDFLFNLSITESTDRLSGLSSLIEKSYDWSRPDSLNEFGILLGYSFALGLMDLHQGNIIASQAGLQVIDAEVIGYQMTLPNESLLIPFKTVDSKQCGLSAAGVHFDHLSAAERLEITKGYFYVLDSIYEQRSLLLSLMDTAISTAHDVPVRVILRDTMRYRNWKNEHF